MGESRKGILVIDREGATAAAAGEAALQAGIPVRVAATLTDGLRALQDGSWAVTVLSMDLLDQDWELVRRVLSQPRAGGVVLTVSRPTPSLMMEATRLGVVEVLASPATVEQIAHTLTPGAADGERIALPELGTAAQDELVGRSPALLEVFKTVGRVAGSNATVLVTGESGTGKELVARAVHQMSPRAGGAFVAVNCAAIPEDLLESELFGHERGAFTGAVARKLGRFERADGGTLFLDEIGDMSLVLQAKILRAIQEKEIERLGGDERIRVDVRIVAATHRDLPALIAEGEFREDLYYRLAVVRLQLAPLRERPEDVRDLTLHYTARFAAEHGRPLRYIGVDALERLEAHPWPGNVRELRNVLERGVLGATGDTLRAEHLHLDSVAPPTAAGELLPGYQPTLSMAEVEALHLARVLEEVDGHLGRAADILGMHRNTVSRKALEYGLRVV